MRIKYRTSFTGLVFKMLLAEGMISEELVENMRSWKHSCFSVHCGKPIKACDADGRKTLSEYISRAPFSLERMSFNEDSKTVLYNMLQTQKTNVGRTSEKGMGCQCIEMP